MLRALSRQTPAEELPSWRRRPGHRKHQAVCRASAAQRRSPSECAPPRGRPVARGRLRRVQRHRGGHRGSGPMPLAPLWVAEPVGAALRHREHRDRGLPRSAPPISPRTCPSRKDTRDPLFSTRRATKPDRTHQEVRTAPERSPLSLCRCAAPVSGRSISGGTRSPAAGHARAVPRRARRNDGCCRGVTLVGQRSGSSGAR